MPPPLWKATPVTNFAAGLHRYDCNGEPDVFNGFDRSDSTVCDWNFFRSKAVGNFGSTRSVHHVGLGNAPEGAMAFTRGCTLAGQVRQPKVRTIPVGNLAAEYATGLVESQTGTPLGAVNNMLPALRSAIRRQFLSSEQMRQTHASPRRRQTLRQASFKRRLL